MKKISIILIFSLGLIIFFWPVLIQGKIYSLGGITKNDLFTFHYPNYKFFHDSLIEGRLPLWTTHVGDGFPIMAEGQLGVFYPPNLFFFRLSDTRLAISLLLFTHFLIAAIGMYLLVYKLTKSNFASLISGFSFSLSGFMVAQLVQVNYLITFSWLPLFFFLYLKLREKFKPSTLLLLGITMAMQILSGFITIFYYQLVVVFIFGLLSSGLSLKQQIKSAIYLILPLIIALSLSAVQILPSLELFKASSREEEGISIENQELFPFPREGFLSFLGIKAPDQPEWITDTSEAKVTPQLKNPYAYYSYIGIIPLVALPFGVLITFKRKNYALIICVIWAFLMALGPAIPVFKLFYYLIPGMKYFRHSIRFLGFVEFFLILISAFALASIGHLFKGRKSTFILTGLILIVFADLYFHQTKINPTDRPDFWLDPPEIVSHIEISTNFRVSGYSVTRASINEFSNNQIQKELLNFLPSNYISIFGISGNRVYSALDISNISSFMTTDPLTNEKEFDIAAKQQEGKLPNDLILEDELIKKYQAQAVRYVISAFPIRDSQLTLVWQKKFQVPTTDDILGREVDTNGQVSRVFTWHETIDSVYLYEINSPLPRLRFVNSASPPVRLQNKDLLFPDKFDLSNQIIVDGIDKEEKLDGQGEANIIYDNETELKISAKNNKQAWLYLADTYYPGWHAYIDGKETEIYKANYAFRALKLPAGRHDILFVYSPNSLREGELISFFSIFIIAFQLALLLYQHAHKHSLK